MLVIKPEWWEFEWLLCLLYIFLYFFIFLGIIAILIIRKNIFVYWIKHCFGGIKINIVLPGQEQNQFYPTCSNSRSYSGRGWINSSLNFNLPAEPTHSWVRLHFSDRCSPFSSPGLKQKKYSWTRKPNPEKGDFAKAGGWRKDLNFPEHS